MILNKLCFGGLFQKNNKSISLRELQIEKGFRIHTSCSYNESIDVISEAVKNSKKLPNITLKVLYNIGLNNTTPYEQIQCAIDKLNFIPSDFHIELEGSYEYLNIEELLHFDYEIKRKFNVQKLLLSTFENFNCINQKKKISENIDGFVFSNNLYSNNVNKIKLFNKKYVNYSMLGGGTIERAEKKYFYILKNPKKFANEIENFFKDSLLNIHLSNFLKTCKDNNFLYGVVSCSNEINFKNLLILLQKKHSENLQLDFDKIDEFRLKYKYQLDLNIEKPSFRFKLKKNFFKNIKNLYILFKKILFPQKLC